jgi:hypothetical protein
MSPINNQMIRYNQSPDFSDRIDSFKPIYGRQVYTYKRWNEEDAEGNQITVEINLSEYGQNLIIEKIAQNVLISRISLSPGFREDRALNRCEASQFFMVWIDYKIWLLCDSPDVVEREKEAV